MLNPPNAAELNKMTLLVTLGFGKRDIIIDQDKSSPSGLRSESEVQKWRGQLLKDV